jgi:hypothetical protein
VEAAGGWNKIIPLVRSTNISVQHAGLLLCGSLVINCTQCTTAHDTSVDALWADTRCRVGQCV